MAQREPPAVADGRADRPGVPGGRWRRAAPARTTPLLPLAMAVLVLAAVFAPLAPPALLVAWAGAGAALGLAQWVAVVPQPHRAPTAAADGPSRPGRLPSRRWHGPAAARRSWLVLAQGAWLGAAVPLFWTPAQPLQRLTLVLVVCACGAAAALSLALRPRLCAAFLALALLPALAQAALVDAAPGHGALALGLALALTGALAWCSARGQAERLGRARALAVRTRRRARHWRTQAEAGDRALAEAQAADRAKTLFFAAASHDLRQPLHAMGLFAEALRQRIRDPEVLPLVQRINESVSALDTLFAELMDLSQLDAGRVDVRLQAVAMQPLLQRLRLHFEPVAFEKGLMLSLRGHAHVAWADPVLLERVLRNLVSNAIRYTDDGGVLVSCRRRGPMLLLQVWDSGRGIPPQHAARIFDEYFQVPHPAGEGHPNPRRGLGLGLAIVRRLAGLMQAGLAVRSQPGRGTVFSLTLPAAAMVPAPAAASGAGEAAPSPLTLHGRRIWVVEADPGVRDGLVAVLQAWGATVQACDGPATLEAMLSAAADGQPPELLLVDHDLPGGLSPAAVGQAVRRRWPSQRPPAALIEITGRPPAAGTGTGTDGAPPHPEQPLPGGVLLKPVAPHRLRAMIGARLRLPAATDDAPPPPPPVQATG